MLGIVHWRPKVGADDLGWSLLDVQGALDQLVEAGLVQVDLDDGLVWIPDLCAANVANPGSDRFRRHVRRVLEHVPPQHPFMVAFQQAYLDRPEAIQDPTTVVTPPEQRQAPPPSDPGKDPDVVAMVAYMRLHHPRVHDQLEDPEYQAGQWLRHFPLGHPRRLEAAKRSLTFADAASPNADRVLGKIAGAMRQDGQALASGAYGRRMAMAEAQPAYRPIVEDA